MKIHILYPIKDGPWGGGNQFLKALRRGFKTRDRYADDPVDADVILFNSHHALDTIVSLRRKFPEKRFIHRIDGPISLIRGFDLITDYMLYAANSAVADGTVFQSQWSLERNRELGCDPENCTTILNAPDSTLFSQDPHKSIPVSRKIKLIASSWSEHSNKGFDTYAWLDRNLDFEKYEMLFIGNSPVTFKNIQQHPPLPSQELAEHLKAADIFITASRLDPCSNSLIEAMHCGLPAVAFADGGHPEIVGAAGGVFESADEIPRILEKICADYQAYQDKIALPTLSEVTERYLAFCSASISLAVRTRQLNRKIFLFRLYHFIRPWSYRLRNILVRIKKLFTSRRPR